jgi:glycogen debranching enzyme
LPAAGGFGAVSGEGTSTELLVIKAGDLFMCARPDGDIRPYAVSGEGLYAHDTRHLSELHVSFAGAQPVLLARSTESGSRAVVNQTNPMIVDLGGATVPQETLNLRRTMLVSERLYCHLELRNFHAASIRVPLTVTLAADFTDVFEIRGVRRRQARGETMVPTTGTTSVTFGYQGQDDIFRDTLAELDPPPDAARVEAQRALLTWQACLDPGETFTLVLTVTPGLDGRRPGRRAFARATRRADRDLAAWGERNTSVETDNELFQSVLAASVRDLYALLTPTPGGGRLLAAGIPWYVAPFGRDSLLTAYQSLLLSPQLASDTLLALAQLQARADEPWRDAEPGKILHELRVGELAGAGLIPHTPYYGTVDATPLFVILAAAYYQWTNDLETLTTIRPALDAALEWIDRHGDQDGDGFIEYQRRSSAGLANQGWKDSEDAIVHVDGTLAEGPIALVEAQGYVYLAKTSIAELFEAFGEPDRARELRAQAKALQAAFNEAFWNPAEGTLALALDGRKRQVASVTSNPGHCLYCGIVEDDKASRVAERLMAKDMFSGWGIRTLSSQSPAYNPMSYHNGSVWPHDNAIIAAGLKRYGHSGATMRIATSMFDIAARSRDYRLAELYCGFDRAGNTEIVNYPVACIPQAWATAAPFMLLKTMLGITAHAPSKTLAVVQPELPEWLHHAELRQLRIGPATVTLGFSQAHGITGFALVHQHGQVDVTMAATPR